MSDNPTLSNVTEGLETHIKGLKDISETMNPDTFMLFQVVHAMARTASPEQQIAIKETIQKTMTDIGDPQKSITTPDPDRAIYIGSFLLNTITNKG